MATGTFKVRRSPGAGDPEDATEAQATAMLDAMVGDSGSGGSKGSSPRLPLAMRRQESSSRRMERGRPRQQ